jgi:hypothetical protein
MNFHSMRRAYNRALAGAGVNLQTAMTLASHADAKVHMGVRPRARGGAACSRGGAPVGRLGPRHALASVICGDRGALRSTFILAHKDPVLQKPWRRTEL